MYSASGMARARVDLPTRRTPDSQTMGARFQEARIDQPPGLKQRTVDGCAVKGEAGCEPDLVSLHEGRVEFEGELLVEARGGGAVEEEGREEIFGGEGAEVGQVPGAAVGGNPVQERGSAFFDGCGWHVDSGVRQGAQVGESVVAQGIDGPDRSQVPADVGGGVAEGF